VKFEKGLSDEQKVRLREEVKREFPADPALQEVHYARLFIDELTKDMSSEKRREFVKVLAKKVKVTKKM
jgi:CRISPR/Cas system-associated protein Cas10 (large subunit of type III CRISPR-Cas system)